MFSRFFIERPVLANTLALVTILMGVLSLLRLPSISIPGRGAANRVCNRDLSRR